MKLSIIATHFSTDNYKSYIAEKCFSRTWYLAKKKSPYPIEVIIFNNGKRDGHFSKYATHFIQNDSNNSIGYARNKGFDISTGEFICFVDNDIYPDHRYWIECINLIEKYPDKKLIATPIYTAGHVFTTKHDRGYLDGHLLNARSGSNCLIMRRESFIDIGKFQEVKPLIDEGGKFHYHGLEGREFCDRQNRKGYTVIHTRPALARDMGFKLHNYVEHVY